MPKMLSFTVLFMAFIVWSGFVRKTPDPVTPARIGQELFFDPLLSQDNSISCATCHKPAFAFGDSIALTPGIHGRKARRNTPSAMNQALQASFFWDGRASTLEQQALIPIENPDEMGIPVDSVVARLNVNGKYVKEFREAFHESPNRRNLAKAIAEYERTLETSESAFDIWRMNDDDAGVSESAKRGFELFNGKGKCIQCHFGPDFNNPDFRNIGLFDGKKNNDSGRAAITHLPEDLGRFKIGSLRNVAVTAPYMHDGRFRTLAEVIEFYNDPEKQVPESLNRDSLLKKPLGLDTQEKKDLEAFLRCLTDRRFAKQ